MIIKAQSNLWPWFCSAPQHWTIESSCPPGSVGRGESHGIHRPGCFRFQVCPILAAQLDPNIHLHLVTKNWRSHGEVLRFWGATPWFKGYKRRVKRYLEHGKVCKDFGLVNGRYQETFLINSLQQETNVLFSSEVNSIHLALESSTQTWNPPVRS